MPDHTEREREARDTVLDEYADAINGAPDAYAMSASLDAYRAAVRSAVLAEVREKMEAVPGWTEGWPRPGFAVRLNILAALTQLEATDGR